MLWEEMSYNKFNQTIWSDTEPEVWDDIYNPSEQEYEYWICE